MRVVNRKTVGLVLALGFLLVVIMAAWSVVPKCKVGNNPQRIVYDDGVSDAVPHMPPQNPFLADSSYAIGHANSAQQDSVSQAGPGGPTKRISYVEDVTYVESGPFQFGQFTSSPYADGRRVLWASGADRVVKLDHETHEVLDTYPIRDDLFYGVEEGEEIIQKLNALPRLARLVYMLADLTPMLMDLSGVYTLLDAENQFYVGGKVGDKGRQGITVYGDAQEGSPDSEIVIKRQFELPEEVTGAMVGMNMTFDGRLVIATEYGYVLAIERDFGDYALTRLHFADQVPEESPNGYGWVRNTFAVDRDGGIYIVSNDHMHKVVWTGERLSIDEKDGAWTEPYSNDRGLGSGATPALMGFENEDRFVVITDGDELMNLVLFWRDEIPTEWEQLPGTNSRRIAGILPADMDNLVEKVQSEQSVIVLGYGAVVVNNEPRNVPGWLRIIDTRINALIAGFLGNDACIQPYGLQKFQWLPETQQLQKAWVTTEISSVNAMPIASYGSNMIYTVGARDGEFTLEAIDWNTGASAFYWLLGDQRFNTLFSGVLVDEDGRIHYTSLWGKIRLDPAA